MSTRENEGYSEYIFEIFDIKTKKRKQYNLKDITNAKNYLKNYFEIGSTLDVYKKSKTFTVSKEVI